MDTIKNKVGQAGLIIAALGIMSALLFFLNYNVRLLAWIDMWGETTAWIIRGGLIVGGGILFFTLGDRSEQ